jgi:hypothetical protein
VAWNFALDNVAFVQAFLFKVTLIVDVVVCPAPTPAVNFVTSWNVAGLTPTLLFSVSVLAVVDVFLLFQMILPVLFEPLLDDAIVVVQFCCLIFVVAEVVPFVIPATPEQPVSVAASFTVEFTFVASPSFGNAGVHVSVPAKALHFGGSGPAAPAGPLAATMTETSRDAANNVPNTLRIRTPSIWTPPGEPFLAG